MSLCITEYILSCTKRKKFSAFAFIVDFACQ